MSFQYRWIQFFPATTPNGLQRGYMVNYPPVLGVVMAGGDLSSFSRGDTWKYSSDWASAGIPWPPAAGSSYGVHGMGYDVPSGKVVALVFHAGAWQTWTYDGATWTQVFPAHSPSITLLGGEMTYMAGTVNKLVLFGGTYPGGCIGKSFETWTWDGTDWTQIVTAHNPGTRAGFWFSYSGSGNNLYLFGGLDDCGAFTYYGDTWRFDGTDWTQLSPAHSPSARRNTQHGYYAATGVHWLQGGEDATPAVVSDDWAFDGTDWTNMSVCSSIGPRMFAQSAYDSSLLRLLVYSGVQVDGDPPLTDTWQLESVLNPVPVTGVATANACSTATLNGTVVPNGSARVYFDYGPTTSYGTRVAAGTVSGGGSPVAASVGISGLTPGQTYHFRIVAIPVGYCFDVDGADASFVEGACAAHATVNGFFDIGA